jgi:hypothetical protein
MDSKEIDSVKKDAIKLRSDIRKKYNSTAVEINKLLIRIYEVFKELDDFFTEIIGDREK